MNKLTFIVSDENINRYGFRVLTDGIDVAQFKKNPVMLYMHQRNTYRPTGDEVIGRWENIRKDGAKLLADAVFDENNEFALKIKKKVEGGFIKMASIGVTKKEISTDKAHLVKGQTRATITKSALNEISIVDIGGNDNALKLYQESGEEVALEELNFKPKLNMSNFKTIAISLKLDADASEAEIVNAIQLLSSEKETAQTKLSAFTTVQKTAQKTEAVKLVDAAIKKGVVPETSKDVYLSLFEADHQNTKSAIETLLSAKPDAGANAQLGDFMGDLGSGKQPATTELSFAQLSKENPAKLAQIEKENPQLFAQLLAQY